MLYFQDARNKKADVNYALNSKNTGTRSKSDNSDSKDIFFSKLGILPNDDSLVHLQ